MSEIGDNIKRFRTARGLYQWELGERIGKSQKAISSWECGFRSPTNADVRKMAVVLEVSPADIIGHNEVYDNEFEYIVTSDDMSPELISGDTLTVNSAIAPKDGDLVVVQDKKKHEFVRRIYTLGKMAALMALKPSVRPINTSLDEITIKGKVTEIRRKV